MPSCDHSLAHVRKEEEENRETELDLTSCTVRKEGKWATDRNEIPKALGMLGYQAVANTLSDEIEVFNCLNLGGRNQRLLQPYLSNVPIFNR